ncbi:MAG: pantoate--beta-alanine ligase [Alphaproteobacteria bacterium]|nr:pantoate--beta-alanine ligase [Pelagibacterales bacterium]MAW58965.1 pantoate--beta-alanine ligase [Alphaproteobacteria bacterium]OUV27852.1 MAG: pantoate--beta-alanine ligase [Alphaproteobacteria bacterium TMED109]|tara:strand:+ start:2636 stop:3490 length:855 start_codon:yes stop_codon:yes gene_type:complete
MSIEVIRDLRGLHSSIARHRHGPLNTAASLAIVPTMGAIHEAHEALVVEAKRNANIVLATIFVNPMQFGENEDLDKYPKSELEDIKRLESKGCDIVYIPENETIYPEDFDLTINVPKLSSVLCGKERKNHFQGVATVVAKLLLQSGADYAIFGEKDYQQLLIIKSLVRDLDIPCQIVPINTVRDSNGLALSSRNQYLNTKQINIANNINMIMNEAAKNFYNLDINETISFVLKKLEKVGIKKIDYVEIRNNNNLKNVTNNDKSNARLFIAVYIDEIRLIDNIKL